MYVTMVQGDLSRLPGKFDVLGSITEASLIILLNTNIWNISNYLANE